MHEMGFLPQNLSVFMKYDGNQEVIKSFFEI